MRSPRRRRQHYRHAAPQSQLALNGDALDLEKGCVCQRPDQTVRCINGLPPRTRRQTRRIATAKVSLDSNGIAVGETQRQSAIQAATAWLDALPQSAPGPGDQGKIIADSTVVVDNSGTGGRISRPPELMRTEISAQQYDIAVRRCSAAALRQQRALANVLEDRGIGVAVSKDDWACAPPAFDSALAFAESHRSDARLSQAAIAAADAAIALQRANAAPGMSVSGDYMMSQGVPLYGVSVNVELPIFSRNQGELHKALVQKELALFADSSLRVQLRNELASAYRDYDAKKKALEKSKGIIAMSEKVLNTVEYAYRSGNTTILDLFDAQNTWYGARQSYNGAVIDFLRAEVQVCVAIGDLRPLINKRAVRVYDG